MIAVDTNVLLRRLLNDDDHQAGSARRLFEQSGDVLLVDVVLVEAVWTLRGRRYDASREDVAAVIEGLLEEPNVVFEDKDAVWAALNDFLAARPVDTANGVKRADFADALIIRKAEFVASRLGVAYEGTFTFDLGALVLESARRPR